jgi:hypothetical protein
MNPLEGWKFAPPPPAVQRQDEPLPPAAVILAGIGAVVGVLPSLLAGPAAVYLTFGLVERLARVIPGATLVLSTWMVHALVLVAAVVAALAIPVLQGWGAVRLFTRRDRALLIYGCLPVTGLVTLGALSAALSGDPGDASILLVLLGPAAAAPLALAPSVRRWLDTASD